MALQFVLTLLNNVSCSTNMEINKVLQRQADVERLLHEQLEVLYPSN